ncbi:MAG: hypothetical protein M2R45_04584 [Verrucomicrobia subdivision 3 bacterium]|nr:hypothetical protein [Limisphaerales bacterium]MCS1417359.1 hypothetical protein [Limisphaerales bacterium]
MRPCRQPRLGNLPSIWGGASYCCTINSKTDYQMQAPVTAWGRSSSGGIGGIGLRRTHRFPLCLTMRRCLGGRSSKPCRRRWLIRTGGHRCFFFIVGMVCLVRNGEARLRAAGSVDYSPSQRRSCSRSCTTPLPIRMRFIIWQATLDMGRNWGS